MEKLGSVIYNKLLLQAEEAKEQGFNKLASNILEAIGDRCSDEIENCSYAQLKDDVCKEMWKIVRHLISFYDLQSVNAIELDKDINVWAEQVIEDVEQTLGVDQFVKGANESTLPGE